jgi:hypothetical protein
MKKRFSLVVFGLAFAEGAASSRNKESHLRYTQSSRVTVIKLEYSHYFILIALHYLLARGERKEREGRRQAFNLIKIKNQQHNIK